MKKKIVLHPFLFSLFPLVSLFLHNIDELAVQQIIPFLFVAVIVVTMLFFLGNFFLKNIHITGLLLTLAILFFYSYGHCFENIKAISMFGVSLGRHRYVLGIWVILFLCGGYGITRLCTHLFEYTKILNIVSIFLLCSSFLNIGFSALNNGVLSHEKANKELFNGQKSEDQNMQELPDIYYIILDSYLREDCLQKYYSFDNSNFIDFLKDSGFYVGEKSTSNYPCTFLSLCSSLNMKYINGVMDAGSEDRKRFYQLIKDNNIMHFVKSRGYRFIHFNGPFSVVDYNPYADINISSAKTNELALTLIRTTLVSAFESYFHFLKQDMHQGILNTFEQIPQVKRNKKPNFVFAHIITPHPPFLFGPNGELKKNSDLKLDGDVWSQSKAYIDQIIFVNTKVKELITHLFANNERKPVVIIQADHGPFLDGNEEMLSDRLVTQRMSILNAIYLPNQDYQDFYPEVSPVNTFRIIFNQYLNGDFKQLEDKSYFSTYASPYKFTDVTQIVANKKIESGK